MNPGLPLHEDLLRGATAIADFVYGRTEHKYRRKIYYAADHGHLPIFRIGTDLAARKSELCAALSAAQRADVAA